MIFHQPGNSFSNYTYNATIYHNVEWSHHFHKNFELIYVISGTVNCIVNHQADTLKAGDWGMCLSNEVHAIRSTEDSLFWVGVFSGDFVHAFEKQIKNKTGEHFKFRCSREIEEYLKAVLINETRPHIYVLKSALYAACSEYCRQIPLKERTNKHDILMKDIVDYISLNFQNKIELSDMSAALGYDYYYVSKCFHKIFSMSFTEFLNLYRLEHALMLLTETNKNITSIAYESGFQSIRNFNHVFKAYTGKSPSEYRISQT